MLQIHQFPCLSDNYGFLLHDPDSGETAAIDTPDGGEYLRQADARGWRITRIWNTHWHPDHTGGNAAIVEATGAPVLAPAEVERVTRVDQLVAHGERFTFGRWDVHVIDVSGHTNGHVAFHLPEAGVAFVGDSVFPLGCGRMFEGTPDQFWASLQRIKSLSADTVLHSAHEYSAANARFALHADPDNAQLQAYASEIDAKRTRGEPTVPTLLHRELAANPFLRADESAMQARWGVPGDAAATFAALRAAKDVF
jgi:hydroxyacylglutathione hydrolase